MKTKYDNVFYIQDKQNADMLHLINQAYLLLFERTSPVITPRSQEISQDNLEQITLSQPASCNFQSPRDTVLTESQLRVKETPIITPSSEKISEHNLEQISLSQPETCNLQSPTDTVLTPTQFKSKQLKFKFQVIRFMHHDRRNLDSQKFTFEELKNSEDLKNYTEYEIHLLIKHSKEFHEDNQGNVVYVKQETESD